MRRYLLLPIFLLASACATVPLTGRKQLKLVSNDRIIPMSFTEYEKVLKTTKLSNDKEQTEMVKRVGVRIQKSVEIYMAEIGKSHLIRDFKWEFNLLEDGKTVNAWCMPGGKVAFYTGIMPICKDEQGVAVVMGHEVAHAIANHGRERMSQTVAAQSSLGIVSVALGGGGSLTLSQEVLLQGIGLTTQLGLLKFSRKHESEADEMGLAFMAMAGYDPAEAPIFWTRMSKLSEGKSPPQFISTHPSHDKRISDLNKLVPKVKKKYYRNPK